MKRDNIARIVPEALLHFDGQRYWLHAWSVMPNHVHVVMEPIADHKLSDILHSWKSFTAKAANKILRRKGEFWQPESYDHLIRDQEDFNHAVAYVLSNPIKAGLYDWKWVGRGRDGGRRSG